MMTTLFGVSKLKIDIDNGIVSCCLFKLFAKMSLNNYLSKLTLGSKKISCTSEKIKKNSDLTSNFF